MKNGFITLAIILLVVFWKTGDLTYSVIKEKNQWEQQGTMLAKQYAGMVKVDKVSLYHGDMRYLIAQGENDDAAKMLAWFREEGLFEGLEYEQNLVSENQMKEKLQSQIPSNQFIRLQPGWEKGTPLWETVWKDTSGKYTYSYYDMRTGDFLRSYHLK